MHGGMVMGLREAGEGRALSGDRGEAEHLVRGPRGGMCYVCMFVGRCARACVGGVKGGRDGRWDVIERG